MPLVFVYGTLKKGWGNHYLIERDTLHRFVSPFTTQWKYNMWDLGGFPGITPAGDTNIKGEVYSVTYTTLESLDRLEGVPRLYIRQRTPSPWGEIYIYLLSPEYVKLHAGRVMRTKIPSGDWCEHRRLRDEGKSTPIQDGKRGRQPPL